jgi:hypothetical protein
MLDNDTTTIYQWLTIALSAVLAVTSIISAISSKRSAQSSFDSLREAKKQNEAMVSPHCYLRFAYGERSPNGEHDEKIFNKLKVNGSELNFKASLINSGLAPASDVILSLAKGVDGNPYTFTRLTKEIKLSKVKMVTKSDGADDNINLTITSDLFEKQSGFTPNAQQVIDSCDTILIECKDIFGMPHKTVHKNDGSIYFDAVYNFY